MTNSRPAPAIEATTQPDCVAVIDIGSNSLRLVVYDAPRRAARTLLNEKVMCGLGRGLEKTDRLNAEGVALAKTNLQRFIALARAAGALRIDVLATAAVRDAEDGAEFVNDVEKRFSIRVRVLPGSEAGRLSALGVLSGSPEASGLVGDLGGGSIELAAIGNGRVGTVATLPIGPLRLVEEADDEKELKEIIDRHLESVAWLTKNETPRFYAVGGAWRAIARIHMEQQRYPLHIIQAYTLPRGEAQNFLDVMARQSRKSLEKISTIARKRLEVVPLAARILARILRRTGATELVFSATGLREGHLYSVMDAAPPRFWATSPGAIIPITAPTRRCVTRSICPSGASITSNAFSSPRPCRRVMAAVPRPRRCRRCGCSTTRCAKWRGRWGSRCGSPTR